MSNNTNHVIVTKKVIYEAKSVGIPKQETRDTFSRAGLKRRNGQWESYAAESALLTEEEAVAFFAGKIEESVVSGNAA